MKRLRTCAPLACLAFALAIGACGGGQADQVRLEAASSQPSYMQEQVACVDRAKANDAGIAASRACRCEVQSRWHCPSGCTACLDGGP